MASVTLSRSESVAGQSETAEERKASEARAEQRKRETNVLIAFWAALGMGVASLLIFATAAGTAATAKVFALGVLVGGAAALIGALLGFLFGLPRGASEDRDSAVVHPATQ